jgi:hypothetical protein
MSDVACIQIAFLRAPAHGKHTGGRRARLAVGLGHMSGAMCDPLEQRAVHVRAGMRQVQPVEGALGVGVVDRRPLAREVGQEEEAPGPRRHGLRLGGEGGEGLLAGKLPCELVAEPVGERAGGGEPGHRGVLAGEEPRRVPEPRVAHALGRQRNDEDGGAIHHHHVAGVTHADRQRLRRRVDGARRDRRSGGEAGLGCGRFRHGSGDLGGPESGAADAPRRSRRARGRSTSRAGPRRRRGRSSRQCNGR